ncbi:hypothetical protein ACJJTC_006824 [Scirpophaga incertulas]
MFHHHLLLFFLYLNMNHCFCYKILCFLPYPGKSHYDVFAPVLDELANRGHKLTVVSFFPLQKRHPNRRDVSLVGLAPLNVEVINIDSFDYSYMGFARYLEHIPVVTKLAESNLKLCEKLLDSDVFIEFLNAEGDYDLILVEHFNSDCMLGLIHNYDLPSIGLSSSALLPFSYHRVGAPDNPAYVPGMTLPFTDQMTFLQRVENTLILLFYNIWYEIVIRWEEQKLLERKFGRTLPPIEDVAKNTSVVLVNTHHVLNGVRVFPPSIIEVGGIHLHKRIIKPLTPVLQKIVDKAKHGFILFSFGSLIKGHTLPANRLKAILTVFAGIQQIVIWKWEDNVLRDLPRNVYQMNWLPQYDLLNHPKCVGFITHAGLLSLTESIMAGVPVLAIPILGDQFGNAAHAAQAGLAEVIALRDINEIVFGNALKKIVSDEMQIKASRLSQMYKDNIISPMDTAIYYIEKTARYKGLKMSSQERWLNRFQLASLDVLAFLTMTSAIFVASVYYLCRK